MNVPAVPAVPIAHGDTRCTVCAPLSLAWLVGFVGEVFARVAPKYDKMNDAMSMGVHRLWKRWVKCAHACVRRLLCFHRVNLCDTAVRFPSHHSPLMTCPVHLLRFLLSATEILWPI